MNAPDPSNPPPKGPTFAPDHLANERTYLAWIRTSLAVIGLGFAVAKFGTWLRELSGEPQRVAEAARSSRSFFIGLALIATGAIFALVAAIRYNAVSKQIQEGRVHPAKRTVMMITIITIAVAIAVAALTFSGTPK